MSEADLRRARDDERLELAAREVFAWAARTRRVVLLAATVVGLVLGAVAYAELRAYQLGRAGAHLPIGTGLLSFLPTFAACLFGGSRLADTLVARLRAGVVREASLSHQVPERALDELTEGAG
jgi:cytochrome c-type biogenesis protein CcmH/NrfG